MPQRFDDDSLPGSDEPPVAKVTFASLKAALWVVRYLDRYRGRVILALSVQIVATMMGLAFPYATGELIDVALGKTTASSINAVATVLLSALAINAFCSFIATINLLTAVQWTLADIRRDAYSRLIRLPMAFFSARRVGELAGRISADLSKIEDTLGETFPHFFRQTILLIGGIALIALTSGRLAGVMLVIIPPLIAAAALFGKRLRRLAKEGQDRLAETNVIVEETLQGVATVKAFANEPHEISRYGLGMKDLVRVSLRGVWSYAGFVAFIIFALFGGIVLVLWSGARMVEAGTLTPGELARFILYTTFVAGAMGSFAEVFGHLQQALGATERVREILNEQPELVPAELAGPPSMTLQGSVKLDAVTFRYPSRPEVAVLSDLSFAIRPGQKIALVGPSGAGKSTVVNLLLRFFEPNAGRIMFDGRDAKDIQLVDIRTQVAVVPQDVMLFGGTIAENIAYGKPNANESEIEAAAQRAFAHEFIAAFPERYQTKVGERGIQLSGGQRQRVAIARAVLRNPALLILDEATSSLDAESEFLVQKALDDLLTDRSALIIAHRLATVRRVDCIFVLQNGRLVESGNHAQLIEQGGLYQSLAQLQFADGPSHLLQ